MFPPISPWWTYIVDYLFLRKPDPIQAQPIRGFQITCQECAREATIPLATGSWRCPGDSDHRVRITGPVVLEA